MDLIRRDLRKYSPPLYSVFLPAPPGGTESRQAERIAAQRADETIILNSIAKNQANGASTAHSSLAKQTVNLALRINDSDAAANTVESQAGNLGMARYQGRNDTCGSPYDPSAPWPGNRGDAPPNLSSRIRLGRGAGGRLPFARQKLVI
jgi:hypothetical protein